MLLLSLLYPFLIRNIHPFTAGLTEQVFQSFDRCAMLNVLRILSLDELIHSYKLVRIKADGNSRFVFLCLQL